MPGAQAKASPVAIASGPVQERWMYQYLASSFSRHASG